MGMTSLKYFKDKIDSKKRAIEIIIKMEVILRSVKIIKNIKKLYWKCFRVFLFIQLQK